MEQCKLAGIDQKIKSMEKGLQTNLFKDFEEDGIELSGGQQQKLAIARAIYKNAPIVIMDELLKMNKGIYAEMFQAQAQNYG